MGGPHGGLWGGDQEPPTLRDGQAAEFLQRRGGCWAAEQGQRVGGQGTAVGVGGQGHTGLQEVPRSGNGAPLLLRDGVGSGALRGCPVPPPTCPPAGSQGAPRESSQTLILPPSRAPAACGPGFQNPIPFLLVPAFFRMRSEHSVSTQRSTGGIRQSPDHPVPPTPSPGWLLRTPAQAHFILQASLQVLPPPGSPPTLIMLLPQP